MSHSIIVYFGSFTLRSLCLAGLAFILVAVVRSAAIRHAIWASVLLIMLSMPLADILLPPSVVPARIRRIMVSPAPTLHRFGNSSALEPEIVSAPPYALARNALARNGSADLWSVAL